MHYNLIAFFLAAIFALGGQSSNNTSLPIRHENQGSFTVIGITTHTNNTLEAGPDGQIKQLWVRAAHGALAQVPERTDDNIVAVYSGYAGDEHGEYDYTLGVRVKDGTIPPPGFVARAVASGRYAVLLSDQGVAPEVVSALWRKIWILTPAELEGNRSYRSDFEIYPPNPDEGETTVTIHIGLMP